MSYFRGGKVWADDPKVGWVALEEDWQGDMLPQDLVSESSMIGVDFTLVDPIERASLGGYAEMDGDWFFYLSSKTLRFHNIEQEPVYLLGDFNGWERSRNYLLKQLKHGQGITRTRKELEPFEECEFKFCTEGGKWVDPHSQFPYRENDSSIKNFWFHQKRSGRDLLRFRLVRPNAGLELEKWIQTRPVGNFGFSYDGEASFFRLFAPRAQGVKLALFAEEKSKKEARLIPMNLGKDGSWSVSIAEDARGKFYQFLVQQLDGDGELFSKEIVDPYAKAICGRNGPAVAIFPTFVEEEKKFQPPALVDAVVVEAHLRDLLAHAPCELTSAERLEFNGLSKWLISEDCYLRKLGANVVELQPVQEFDAKQKNEYHWGYMPVNFFSPASVYCSASEDGRVIDECKQMVSAFHSAGMAVVIDVVYNHVGIPPHLMHLDREMYFLNDESGNLTNFSGCGNDLNCHAEPVRKLILDSLIYWVKVFDVDGFRFDLGELLGVELLAEIETELKKIKPGILLFAEPWSFRGRLPQEMNQTGYALWSDLCREELLLFAKNHTGNGSVLELLKNGLDRENQFPCQSLNYLESHDDYALVDRFREISDPVVGDSIGRETVSRVMLALGLLLVAPGVPMISAGQDFLRHKRGIRNTYLEGDVNALNYSLQDKFAQEVQFVREMIRLRLGDPGRRARYSQSGEWEVYTFTDEHSAGFAFGWESKKTRDQYLITANPSDAEIVLPLPESWHSSAKRLASYNAEVANPCLLEPLSFCWFSY